MWLNNRTIGFRLMCGFGIIVILTMILGLYALTRMHTLAELTVKMYEHPLAVSNAVKDVKANVFAMHRTMKDVAMSEDVNQANVAMEQVDQYEQEVFESFEIIFERFLGDKEDVQKARKAFSDWKAIRQEVYELIQDGKHEQAESITKGKGRDHVDYMVNTIQAMNDFADDKAENFFKNSQRIHKQQMFLMNALITIIAISSVVVGILISRSVTNPIGYIIEEIKEVAKGDFNRKVSIDGTKEIDQLASEFNSMVAELNESTTSINILNEEIARCERLEEELHANNQQLHASEQQLRAANQQLSATEQQLRASCQQLKGSEEKYRRITENIETILWEYDISDDCWTYVSPQSQRLLGYAPEEWTNLSFWTERLHEDDREWASKYCSEFTLRGEDHDFEYRFLKKDGQVVWIRDVVSVEVNNGIPVKLYGFMSDITKQKEKERQLSMLSVAIEQVPVGIALADKDLNLYFCNAAGLGLRGDDSKLVDIPKEAYDNWQVLRLNGEPYEIEELPLVKAVSKGMTTREEFIVKHQDGSEHICDATASPVYDQTGIIGGVVVFPDITNRKKFEQDNRLNDSRLETLLALNKMKDASVAEMAEFVSEESIRLTKSKIGFFGFMNEDQTAMRIHAWSREAMAGCEIKDKPLLFPIEDSGVWGNCIRQRETVVINNYSLPDKNKKGIPGGHVPLTRLISLPIFEGDKIVAVAAVANKQDEYTDWDVKQLELLFNGMWEMIRYQQIQRDRDKLLKELEFKNDELQSIVYISSHDLKTPLVNIKGFSDLLIEHSGQLQTIIEKQNLSGDVTKEIKSLINEDIHQDLDIISKSTDRMKGLIEGLLKVSRIGTIELNLKEVDMNKVFSEIFDIVKFQIDDNQTDINVDELPSCKADEDMIKQVFTNLVDNAVKYFKPDQKGSINITGHREDGKSIYCVEDNGIGIMKEHQGRIFEIYHRLNPQGPAEGQGLGLTIIKRILNRHNGDIWLESEETEGSKFFISLPHGAEA